MSRADELTRQQAVWALLSADEAAWDADHAPQPRLLDDGQGSPSTRPPGAARLRWDQATLAGLRAYQVNAQATARRVLQAHFPVMEAMVGEETLSALALILWRTSPPAGGDLGEWGAALPGLLARHGDLQDWPWLADSAQLEWVRHLCERAADAQLDAQSLQRLGDTPPDQLQLVLMPGLQCLASPWPLRALWEAHQLPPEAQEQAAMTALQGLSGEPGTLLVWRAPDWQVRMQDLDPAQGRWMRMLLDAAAQTEAQPSLSQLLDAAPAELDFSAWLGEAIRAGWLWRVAVVA